MEMRVSCLYYIITSMSLRKSFIAIEVGLMGNKSSERTIQLNFFFFVQTCTCDGSTHAHCHQTFLDL